MFVGEFNYRVDDKGRIPIPPKFRTEELRKDGVMLCPGVEKCVTVYPPSEWKRFADSLTSAPIITSRMRKLHRAIFANSFEAELDGQGRIGVPAKLRQHAGISDDVMVVGVNRYVEIWERTAWEAENAADRNEVFQIIENLEEERG